MSKLIKKDHTKVTTEESTADAPPAKTDEQKAKEDEVKDDLDNLLDEIDEVLENNAAEFVANYVQKGGQ